MCACWCVLLCLQDNVALIAVLEMVEQQSGSKQLLCVANTHIHANPELNDVKLWQVHTLLKGLEKIANRWGVPWKGICSAMHEVDLHCAASTVGGSTLSAVDAGVHQCWEPVINMDRKACHTPAAASCVGLAGVRHSRAGGVMRSSC